MKIVLELLVSAILMLVISSCEPQPNTAQLNKCLEETLALTQENAELKLQVAQNITDTVLVRDTLVTQIVVTEWDTVLVRDTLATYITVTKWDTVFVGNKEFITVQVVPERVVVDAVHDSIKFGVQNLVDGNAFHSRSNTGTRWAVAGYPHSAIFFFSEVTNIDSIAINTFGWDEDYTHNISVWTWGDSITTFQTKPELYSKHYVGLKTSQIMLQINSGKNAWTDLGEVQFFTNMSK